MKEFTPSHYALCFNNQCVRSSECLRHMAGENSNPEDIYIRVVNPLCIPADTSECPHFQLIKKHRMAWGIKNVLNKVPYKEGVSMRKQLISHFGKTGYYRIYRHERALLPKDQEYIRKMFMEKGITEEPNFERFTEEYYYE